MSKRRTPESGLVHACLQWLAVSRIFAWRNNTGVLRSPRGQPVPFGFKGSSDILCILPPHGRFLAVECKVGRGTLTVEQRAFLDEVNRAGGLGVVVRDLEDLIAYVEGATNEGA